MRILIVEDEDLTRGWIKKKIEEIDADCNTECFKDAVSALEFLKDNGADVIFTDIRLPFMNGLEFLKELNKRNIKAYKVILSAYDEFDYAREAMKIGIKDFLLKTEVTKEKLKEVLDSAKESISYKKAEMSDANSIFYSPNMEMTEIYGFFDFYGLSRDLNSKACALLYFEKDMSKTEIEDFINRYLEYNNLRAWHQKLGSYEYIILFDKMPEIMEIESLRLSLGSFIGRNIYMGISFLDYDEPALKKRNINPLGELRRKAELAVENRIFFCDTSFISYKDMYVLAGKDSLELCFNEEKINILKHISDKNYQTAYSKLGSLLNKVKISSHLSVGYVKNLFNEILRAYFYAGADFLDDGAKAKYNEIMEKIFVGNSENIYTLEEQILTVVSEFAEKAGLTLSGKKYSETTYKILNYIDENYKSQAIVGELSKKLFFSRNYISALFKKDTGITVSKYITEVRLGKAKKLLSDTNLSISEIALEIGYFDVSHFSRVFKEEYGDSPLEFRKKYTKTL